MPFIRNSQDGRPISDTCCIHDIHRHVIANDSTNQASTLWIVRRMAIFEVEDYWNMRNQWIWLWMVVVQCAGLQFASAQSSQHCGTDEKLNAQLANDPAFRYSFEQLNAQWASQAGSYGSPRGGVRKIPVVVHIIQSSSLIAISDARIQSQIDVLNEDYRHLNADTTNTPAAFQSIATDCEIEFCLATIDPFGCPTTGINRIVSPGNANHNSNQEAQLKGLIQWPPRKYLNIWVPESMPGLLGYATFPTQLNFSPTLDGVVLNGQNIGRGNGIPASTYDKGRTATHEVGHWLGLFHTFQSGCAGNSAGNCASQGDFICDTPPTANENYGCPGAMNTCTETPTDLPDQTVNYMDYVDDACMNMFSLGQRTRMYFYLDNVRNQIWAPLNLAATGCDGTVSPGCAPNANFVASPLNACTGQPIQFSDLSTGPASGWQWTFTGGSPSSDSTANPSVIYSQPGIYDVELTVQNGFGTDTETRIAHIVVTDPASPPVAESFENILFLPVGWATQDQGADGTWEVSTTSSSLGQNSMRMPNYTLAATGSTDALVSLPFDLTNMGSAKMTYDLAYKRRTAFLVDSLRIEASTDCGASWTRIKTRAGGTLVTIGGSAAAAPYVPAQNDWKTDTIDLTPFVGFQGVKVRFELKSGGGQNIYLDAVNLDAAVAIDAVTRPFNHLVLAPNPSTDAPHLRYERMRAGTTEISLTTLQGRQLLRMESGMQPAGSHEMVLPENVVQALPAGMYLIRVASEGSWQTVKWVKAAK